MHNYAGSSGHLYVQDLTIGYGYISGSGTEHGGCIASLSGALTLTRVNVYNCSATTTGLSTDYPVPNAFGGAVFAANGLDILASEVLHGTAAAPNAGVRAQGGCAMTFGPFFMIDSTIAFCAASGPNIRVRGGALELKSQNVNIVGSAVGKAYSNYIAGIDINPGGTGAAVIANSTITSNVASLLIGGVYSNAANLKINNSTIVANRAGQYSYTYNAKPYNAAVGVSFANGHPASVSLQSNIISNNSAGGVEEDFSIGASPSVTIAASNNLVYAYKSDVTLPAGQGNLSGICPKLGWIKDNGGPTPTHALRPDSPMIDAGNNTANDPRTGVPALYDQRDGPPTALQAYPRVHGAAADIGAYEFQGPGDSVFNTDFEDDGCPQ